jgi:hypothetical protein
VLSDTKVANRNGRGFGWEIAHAADSRRPPISLYAILSPYSTYACTRTRRKFGICSSSACTSCSHEAPTLVIHLAGGRRLVRRAAGGGQQRRHGAARLHASRFHLALQPHEDTVRHAQRLDDAGALAARCLRPKTPALRACSQTHRPPSTPRLPGVRRSLKSGWLLNLQRSSIPLHTPQLPRWPVSACPPWPQRARRFARARVASRAPSLPSHASSPRWARAKAR